MKVTLYDFEHRGEGTYISCYVPTKLDLRGLGNLASGDLLINDCRMISRKQQKKIYALCRDISNYTGHEVEDLKENILKVGFMIKENREYFSLSNVDMTTARYFIEYILEFCFEFDIPLSLMGCTFKRKYSRFGERN